MLAGCVAPWATTSPSGSPSETASTAGSPSSAPSDEIAERVDIGDGRLLYLECRGTGSPTILLEAGDESDIGQWRLVIPILETATRVCAYERAGIGRSSDAAGCRQMDDLLGDLEALLAKADIEAPYVLVGTSGGGFIMTGYAMRHPDYVAGMVLVETPKALTAERYPAIVAQIACDAPANIERRDYLAVEHEAWDNRHEVGDFPMTVISNDYGRTVPAGTDEATNVEDQHDWLVLTSGTAKQVVVTSGHDVPEDNPRLVADEILAVLEAGS
jgi:pimeloyl-ACP methyl ester carboxylesterase